MRWTDVACRQGGLINRGQLVALGVAVGTIDGWLADGRLQSTAAQGVYRVAGAPRTPESAAWFAALSTRSVVSFVSAALWWQAPVRDDGLVHVTRFDRRRLDWPAGVRVHRVALDRAHVVRHRGLWVTTRTETLVDCLRWLPWLQARTLADRAVQQGWLTVDGCQRRLAEQPNRWGNRQLRRIVVGMTDGAAAESERQLHRLLRRAGIGGWRPNVTVTIGGRRFVIDVAFPASKIAIEVDGYGYHSADAAFQTDRTRQNLLIAAGWRVLRFTWADITERPGEVVAQICALVAA